MTELADLLLWPETVEAFYADRACSLRSGRCVRRGVTPAACWSADTPVSRSAGSRPTISSRS